MSEMSFEQMLEETLTTIRRGDIVKGTVIAVKPDEIVLNIGYKADGIILRKEYTHVPNADLTTMVNVGDVMDVKVLKLNDGEGAVSLSYRKILADKNNKVLEEAFENKTVLTGNVERIQKGGLIANYEGTSVFIPVSLVSESFEKDLSIYLNKDIEFVIIEFDPKKRRIIGDRKRLLVAKKAEARKALYEKIKKGDVVEGVVKNITEFGCFIDIGGADGLLHISEMSWKKFANPKKLFKVGDIVHPFIKDISEDRIALSMKFPNENPWNDAAELFAVGNVVTGKVVRMTDFGAFVELKEGIDALLHVSQICKERIEKPSDVLKVGQEIEAAVIELNEETKKISLSMKVLIGEDVIVEEVSVDTLKKEAAQKEAEAKEAIAKEEEVAKEAVAEEVVAEEAVAEEVVAEEVVAEEAVSEEATTEE